MNKKLVIVFLAGWVLAFVLPPSKVVGMFRGSSS